MIWLLIPTLQAAPSPGGNPLVEPEYRVPQGYVAYRAASPPAFDGQLEAGPWAAAPWTDEFADIEGDRRPRPRFRTRAKMLWDDQYLYIAAQLDEPHVWGTLTERDSVIFQDPDFEVFLDPDGDGHEYYEFEINALNTGWDLRLPKPYKDGGPALNEWDIAGLRTAVHIDGTLNDPSDTDRGWTVELAFPWAALGEYSTRPAPPLPGDQWRINFSRVEWDIEVVDGRYRKIAGRPEHNWVWSPQGIIDMHRPERWGYVQFSDAPTGSEAFRPDPALGARDLLARIYYAQHRWRAAHGAWAARLEDLDLPALTAPRLAEPPALRRTADGWEASAVIWLPHGGRQRWVIRHDARITAD